MKNNHFSLFPVIAGLMSFFLLLGGWDFSNTVSVYNAEKLNLQSENKLVRKEIESCFQELIFETGSNTSFSSIVRIDHPFTNKQPDGILIIAGLLNAPPDLKRENMMVRYFEGYWHIEHEDGKAIPSNVVFHLLVNDRPAEAFFTLTSLDALPGSHEVIIDHPGLDRNPGAQPLITQEYWPGYTPSCELQDPYYKDGKWRIPITEGDYLKINVFVPSAMPDGVTIAQL